MSIDRRAYVMILFLEDLLRPLLYAKVEYLNRVVIVLASEEKRDLLSRLVSEASTIDLEDV